MVARSSKRISSTLQEFIRPQNPTKSKSSFDMLDSSAPSQQAQPHPKAADAVHTAEQADQPLPTTKEALPRPMVVHFKVVLKALTIGAALLPSLKARYQMGQVTSVGISGKKARFNVDLPSHSLSFTSKVSFESTREGLMFLLYFKYLRYLYCYISSLMR